MTELGAGLSIAVPLSIGTLQWGTTPIDQHMINPNGCITEHTALEIVEELRKNKVTFFDTAEGYGGGTSEKRLGRIASKVYPSSEKPILMTKFLPTFWRFSHGCFERALRASNRRMGIDCCPIYLLHSPVHWRPIEFWVEAAAICKKKGLLMALGLSNCNADEVRRAHQAGIKFGVPVVVNQVMYSLLDYNSEKLRDMEKVCNDLGITIVAYSPIGQGLLTDGLTPERFKTNRPAKMTGLTWDSLEVLRESLRRVAGRHGKTMAQVAINWCICHGTVPLVGCRSAAQARDTCGALGWKLSSEDMEELDRLALGRSTLESPRWRRALFVVFFGCLFATSRALDWLGLARPERLALTR
mmetsp:Transcript_33187/g.88117  ORF Transcript_33187/g.88117 Transcript_33187/m.88117 type:complete len:356 (-) Transcript_33187:38-1105(-)